VVAATQLASADRVAIHFMSPRTQEGAAARRSWIDAGVAPQTVGERSRAIDTGLLEDGTVYVVVANLEQADLRRLLSSEAIRSPGDVEHGRERARQRLLRLRSSTRHIGPPQVP